MRLAAILALASALAAADVPIIAGGVADFAAAWPIGLSSAVVDTPDQGKVLRLAVSQVPADYWDAQIWVVPIAVDIADGDRISISFRARCTAPGQGQLQVLVGANQVPWTQAIGQRIGVGPEWKEYVVSGPSQATLPAAIGRFGFQLGFQAQSIEIARIAAVVSK